MQRGEPRSSSGKKVIGIRNCVSVRLTATDFVWLGTATDVGLNSIEQVIIYPSVPENYGFDTIISEYFYRSPFLYGY